MSFGLIFDLDGVIADTESLSSIASVHAFRDVHQLETTIADSIPFMGSVPSIHFRGIGEKYGIDADTRALFESHSAYFGGALLRGEISIFPGVRLLIEAISSANEWCLGLATSSHRSRAQATLHAMDISPDRFASWKAGDDVNKAKPDPEIYLLAAEDMGCATAECIAIEDSIAGVAAAKAAGMTCLAVTNTFPEEKLKEADHVVDTLEGVDIDLLTHLLTMR